MKTKLCALFLLFAFLPFASGIIWIQPSRFTAGGGGFSTTPDILWLKHQDGSGTTIDAAVGPDFTTDGTWGANNSGPGAAGYSLEYDGSGDESVQNSQVDFQGQSKLTLCVWLKDDATSGTKVVIETGSAWDSGGGRFILLTVSSLMEAGVSDAAGTGRRSKYCNNISLSTWTHVAVVFDWGTSGGNVKIYFDGVAQSLSDDATNFSGTTTVTNSTVNLGARDVGGTPSLRWQGAMTDLRIFAGELTAEQIGDVMDDYPPAP